MDYVERDSRDFAAAVFCNLGLNVLFPGKSAVLRNHSSCRSLFYFSDIYLISRKREEKRAGGLH